MNISKRLIFISYNKLGFVPVSTIDSFALIMCGLLDTEVALYAEIFGKGSWSNGLI